MIGITRKAPTMTTDERDGKIRSLVEEAMRLGAALGTWTKPPTEGDAVSRRVYRVGRAALDAGREIYVTEAISLAEIEIDDERPRP